MVRLYKIAKTRSFYQGLEDFSLSRAGYTGMDRVFFSFLIGLVMGVSSLSAEEIASPSAALPTQTAVVETTADGAVPPSTISTTELPLEVTDLGQFMPGEPLNTAQIAPRAGDAEPPTRVEQISGYTERRITNPARLANPINFDIQVVNPQTEQERNFTVTATQWVVIEATDPRFRRVRDRLPTDAPGNGPVVLGTWGGEVSYSLVLLDNNGQEVARLDGDNGGFYVSGRYFTRDELNNAIRRITVRTTINGVNQQISINDFRVVFNPQNRTFTLQRREVQPGAPGYPTIRWVDFLVFSY